MPKRARAKSPVISHTRIAGAWRWARAVFITLWIVAPLAFLPTTAPVFNAFDTPRRLLLLLGGGVSLALMLLAWGQERRIRWQPHILDLAVAAFTLATIISACMGEMPYLSCFAPLWSHDALPLLGIGLLQYAAVRGLAREPRDIADAAALLVIMGGIVALIGVCELTVGLGLNPSFFHQRLLSTLGNPMFAGTYFAMLLPLALGMSPGATPRRRVWLLVAACACVLALLLTLTRGAWLAGAAALIIVGIVVAVRRDLPRPHLPRLGIGLLAVLLALAALTTLHPAMRARLASLSQIGAGTMSTRKVYLQTAWNAFRARPLTGWGMGAYRDIASEFRPSSTLLENGIPLNRGFAFGLPHNLPAQVAAETGVLGLLPFLLLVIVALVTAFRPLPAPIGWTGIGLAGALTAYHLANLAAYDNALTSGLWWIVLGLIATLHAAAPHEVALQPVVARICRIKGIALIIVFCIVASGQLLAAIRVRQGALALDFLQSSSQLDTAEALRVSRSALAQFQEAISVTLPPSQLEYQMLCKAQRAIMYAARNAGDVTASQQAHDAMFAWGTTALRMNPRDSDLLILFVTEYLADKRVTDARAMVDRLVRTQPCNAGVRLFDADVATYEKDYPRAQAAAKAAIALDPTFPDAYAALASYLFNELETILSGSVKGRDPRALVLGNDRDGARVLTDSLHHFAETERLGASLTPAQRLQYFTALALASQTDKLLARVPEFHDDPNRDVLGQRINYFYALRGDIANGKRLLATLMGE